MEAKNASSDPNQIRINELARELEVKAKAIIDLLPEFGVADKKVNSSSIPADVAEKVRKHLRRVSETKGRATSVGISQMGVKPTSFDDVVSRLRGSRAQIDEIEDDRLSVEVRSVLGHADRLRSESHAERIQVEHILIALSRWPGRNVLSDLCIKFNIDLKKVLEPGLILKTVTEDEATEPTLRVWASMGQSAQAALEKAVAKANRVGSKLIELDHLVFGALSVSENRQVATLNSLGVTAEAASALSTEEKQETIGAQSVNAVDAMTPADGLTGAATVTGTTGTTSPEAVARSLMAGYNSDDAAGDDLLNITEEVNTLASVLAAREVEPPLSLGLFGEWGTGKSFFMKKLEARIKTLADDAKKAEEQQIESAYCSSVLQITFNAWSYIDSDLWASLTSEIFENLASEIAHLRDPKSEPDAEKRTLALAAASSSQTVLESAEKTKHAAEIELTEMETKLSELQKSEAAIEAKLRPAEVLKQALGFAMQDDDVKKYVEDVRKTLKLPEIETATGQVQAEILELEGTLSSTAFTLKHNKILWIWIGLLVLFLGAGWESQKFLSRQGISEFVTRSTALGVTAIGFIVAVLTPLVRMVSKLSSTVERARVSKQELIEKKKRERVAELEKKRDAVRQQLEAATKSAVEAYRRVNELNEQIENLRKDRQTADFIRARHESSDYTQRLGTISRVRNDLKQLSVLLRDARLEAESDRALKARQREEERKRRANAEEGRPEKGRDRGTAKDEKQGPLFPRIDRIVLYIDDLDRCPEETVVKVLQAVHLLLAFPLFVVVVGVDPRWLLYSLKRSSKAFRNQETGGGEVEKKAAGSRRALAFDADELSGKDFSDSVYIETDSEARISEHGRSVCEEACSLGVEFADFVGFVAATTGAARPSCG